MYWTSSSTAKPVSSVKWLKSKNPSVKDGFWAVLSILLDGLTYIRTWINNDIHGFLLDVIFHPNPNSDVGLTKSPLKWGHGWVITYHGFSWESLLIDVLVPKLLWLIYVSKKGPGHKWFRWCFVNFLFRWQLLYPSHQPWVCFQVRMIP